MGPLLIFDKSALQSFTLDESVWLENFFLTNITPLFFVESLADLEKEVSEGKTPEDVVGALASKTPVNGSFSNVHHALMFESDLMGSPIAMDMRTIIHRGTTKQTPTGEISVFYKQSPEEAAFQRWKDRKFLEVEREVAKKWREALSNLSFDSMIGTVKNIVPVGTHFSNMQDVKTFVDEFVKGKDKALLDLTFIVLGIREDVSEAITARWQKEGCPPLNIFAPYAAYALSVDLFLYLCMNSSFISKQRQSNKIDFSYLYYLPFCRVFVSNDNLHERTIPLFLKEGQKFIKGVDLKAGLRELDEYYSKLPEDVKNKGVMSFASYPPRDVNTFIGQLFNELGWSWQKDAEEKDKGTNLPPDKELLKRFKDIEDNAQIVEDQKSTTSDEADSVFFQRFSTVKKGKWNVLPKDIGKIKKVG